MKAYYKNGRVCFAEPKCRKIKFLAISVILIAWILITLTPFNSSKGEFRHECGIEIPGLKDQTFCIAHNENGIYYYNEKFEVKVK